MHSYETSENGDDNSEIDDGLATNSIDPLSIYLRKIGDFPLLSREEERELTMDILEKRQAFRRCVLTSEHGARRAFAMLSEVQSGIRPLDQTIDIRPIDHRGIKVPRKEQQDSILRRIPANLRTLGALLCPAQAPDKRRLAKAYALFEETPLATDLLRAMLQKHHKGMYRIADALAEKEQELSCHNLRLVVAMAKRYRGQGLPFSDLIQEGNVGLLRAVQKFEPRLGWKFSTYATWWIRNALTSAIANTATIVRVSAHTLYNVQRAYYAAQEYIATNGEEPPMSFLKRISGESRETLDAVAAALCPTLSIDTPHEGKSDDDATVADLIRAPNERAGATAEHDELRARIQAALRSLPPIEAEILRLRFGLDYESGPLTLDDIGKQFGITREWVRRLEKNGLDTLRIHQEIAAQHNGMPRLAEFL